MFAKLTNFFKYCSYIKSPTSTSLPELEFWKWFVGENWWFGFICWLGMGEENSSEDEERPPDFDKSSQWLPDYQARAVAAYTQKKKQEKRKGEKKEINKEINFSDMIDR